MSGAIDFIPTVTASEDCGRGHACGFCPDEASCNLDKQRHAQDHLQHRLGKINWIIPVLANKGGVGKSTIATALAFGLQRQLHPSVLPVGQGHGVDDLLGTGDCAGGAPAHLGQDFQSFRLQCRGVLHHLEVAAAQGLVEAVDRRAQVVLLALGGPRPSTALTRAIDYVSGMTDRFALRLAVERLGWEPAALPRGV